MNKNFTKWLFMIDQIKCFFLLWGNLFCSLFHSGLNLTFLLIDGFQIPVVCCPSQKETDEMSRILEGEAPTIHNQGKFPAENF